MAATVTVETNDGGDLLLSAVRERLADLPVEVAATVRTAAAPHPALRHFAGIRELLNQRVHADFDELARRLAELERDMRQALAHCHASTPARVTITATSKGVTMGTYAPGATVDLTADVKNAEGQDVTDPVTWATTAGTISADPTNPLKATLTGAPLGDTTVTATTSNGIAGTDTVTVADQTPASITVTDTAAA